MRVPPLLVHVIRSMGNRVSLADQTLGQSTGNCCSSLDALTSTVNWHVWYGVGKSWMSGPLFKAGNVKTIGAIQNAYNCLTYPQRLKHTNSDDVLSELGNHVLQMFLKSFKNEIKFYYLSCVHLNNWVNTGESWGFSGGKTKTPCLIHL